MTRALEIRTSHSDVSDVVRELAPAVDDESIRLPSEHAIPPGDWVRFAVTLADGTTVFEGIGRSQGTSQEGGRHRVQLSMLQLDARNEVMYERMLLMRDAEQEKTGTLDLRELGAELVRGPSRSAPPPAPSRAAPSRPPPGAMPPARPATARPAAPASPPPGARPAAPVAAAGGAVPRPAAPRAPAAARAAAPRAPAPTAPAEPAPPKPATPQSAAPPAPARPAAAPPASARPARPARPTPAASRPKDPARPAVSAPTAPTAPAPTAPAPAPSNGPAAPVATRVASVPPAALPDDAKTTEHAAPPTTDRRKKRRTGRVEVGAVEAPPRDTVISRPDERAPAGPLRLEIAPVVVERARALARLLPAELLDARAPSPEEAVLRAALRVGLASLAALRDDDD